MNHHLVTAPSGIAYPVWLAGTGDPLLLLHGFTGSHETWEHLSKAFADDHLVITLDLPGHGDSRLDPSQDLSFARVVDDLAWIVDTLAGGKTDLAGYSMGGRLALALAVSWPDRVRRLILESASPGIADVDERLARHRADEQLASLILSEGLDAFVARWETMPMWESQAVLSEPVRERQRQFRLGHTAAGLAANLRATGTGAQDPYWDRLGELTVPVMLIAGELDQKFAQIAALMHDAMPDSRLEVVGNAGHAVHLEQPNRYSQLVSEFLGNQEQSSRLAKGNVHD